MRGRNQAAARGDVRSWRHNAIQYIDGMAMAEDQLSDSESSPAKPNDIASEDRGSVDSGGETTPVVRIRTTKH
jgi:hypothetical protein